MSLDVSAKASSLELPWELIYPILESCASSSPASAASIGLVCHEAKSIARNALYKTLRIGSGSALQCLSLSSSLKTHPELATSVRAIVVDVPVYPIHADTTPEHIQSAVGIISRTPQHSLDTVHVIWANNQLTKGLGYDFPRQTLRSLLCRYLALEVDRTLTFPQLTHLVALHISGVGRFSCPTLNLPALSHFACTFHFAATAHAIFSWLVLPRLTEILDRASRKLPPLTLARFFITKTMLAEYGAQLSQLAEEVGTPIYYTEIPDVMDDEAMQALGSTLSDLHFTGALWEPREMHYWELVRASES